MGLFIERVVLGLLTASVVGLGGWVYNTGSRVTATEVSTNAVKDDVKVIREDVREIRRALLGEH